MTVHVVTHSRCIEHDAGPGHPERPERLQTILQVLEQPEWEGRIEWHEAPPINREQLLRVHTSEYLEFLEETSRRGGGQLDPDTAMNEHSWEVAGYAAGGAVLAATTAIETNRGAFAAIRPPGHHALSDRAMGFCLLANVVVAARQALARSDMERVLIVDWDVHHGNGTQALVETDPSIRFVSMHQWPHYPGTGDEREQGVGNVWNVPRRGGLLPGEYVDDLLQAIDRATEEWSPDLVLISAGFDSMAGDPLAGFTLRPVDYGTITARLRQLGAPVAATLEGGYSLENLASGVPAFLEALL
jgi:acetoin utilization deacetylase AcuC-like enzyme